MIEKKKSLIAYYSKTGNTETIAKMIHELTAGDIYRIDTKKPYPLDYNQTTVVAKQELKANARPELRDLEINLNNYEIIFLGYPNWWGTMPMIVYTFLESYELSGKTIIPFCTHGGGGIGKSVKEIVKCCPNANVINAHAIYGSRVTKSKTDIKKWLENLNIQ